MEEFEGLMEMLQLGGTRFIEGLMEVLQGQGLGLHESDDFALSWLRHHYIEYLILVM